MQESLLTVPGVGSVTHDKLQAAGVTSTFQLIGKFLELRRAGYDAPQHIAAFKAWLATLDIKGSHPNLISRALGEKAESFMPGIFSSYAADLAAVEEE